MAVIFRQLKVQIISLIKDRKELIYDPNLPEMSQQSKIGMDEFFKKYEGS
jgi:hypothetical protein